MQEDINGHKAICSAISEGCEQAFARLYNLHFDRLAAPVFYLLKNKEETEEVLQDVFFSIWNRRFEIHNIINIEAYLTVMARNAALNKVKSNIRRKALESNFILDNEVLYDDSAVAESESLYDELVNEAIAQLPPQQQRAFILSRFGRKKYLEIAAEMDISRETVKKYLQLASASIKAYLVERKDSIISVILSFFIF